MSDQFEGFAENVPGKYYITKSCIGCTLCSVIAPEHFMENTDEELPVGHCYVYKQPETTAEGVICEEAMDVCPADAIRNNG
ncbi:MAG: ferredoxin [Desulfobacteraceae bacterium]|nr:ferredoxin [Desulfobacteraceae bacterium]